MHTFQIEFTFNFGSSYDDFSADILLHDLLFLNGQLSLSNLFVLVNFSEFDSLLLGSYPT